MSDHSVKNYRVYNDRRYYYHLLARTNGLLADYSSTIVKNGLITAYQRNYKKDGKMVPSRLFTLFTSVDDYILEEKYRKREKKPLYFYEIILGHQPQKPHFDVDIECSDPEVLEALVFLTAMENNITKSEELKKLVKTIGRQGANILISNLIKAVNSVMVDLKIHMNLNTDILLYQSHGSKFKSGAKYEKFSYHLLINNYFHANHLEAKKFYNLVIQKIMAQMTEKYLAQAERVEKLIGKEIANEVKRAIDTLIRCIDGAVYSSIQNFRILGNTKAGQKRYKSQIFTIDYMNSKLPFRKRKLYRDQLTDSLITHVAGCDYILGLAEVRDKIIRDSLDLDDKIEEVKTLFNEKYSRIFLTSKPPFKFSHYSSGVINYKRTSPCHCPLCNRKHENENSYLTVSNGSLNVYFHCFRADSDPGLKNKAVLLGKLSGGRNKEFEVDSNKFLVQLVRKALKNRKMAKESVTETTGKESDATGKESVATGKKSVVKTTGEESVTEATGKESVTETTEKKPVTPGKRSVAETTVPAVEKDVKPRIVDTDESDTEEVKTPEGELVSEEAESDEQLPTVVIKGKPKVRRRVRRSRSDIRVSRLTRVTT